MYRVIIADDEPKVSLLIKNLIQWNDLGLELLAIANDGISALAMIDEHRPDIVITDIRMPGYDGIELIDRAKQINPCIDFIIISGYRHFDYAQKAIRFGVEDYLLKPLKAVEINQTLRKMIAKYAERDLAKQREEGYANRIARDAKRLHEQFMANLLVRSHSMESPGLLPATLEQINQDYELGFQADYFQVFIVKADVHLETPNINVRRLLAEKCIGVIHDALHSKCHGALLYLSDNGIYAIANYGEMHRKALRKALGAVIDELQSQGELFDRIKVTVGLGRQCDDINELSVSLKEAERALANRLLFGVGKIIDRHEGRDAAEVASEIVHTGVRARLLKGMEILDDSEIRTVLEGVAAQASAHPRISGSAILALCEECMLILRFGLKSQNAIDSWIESYQLEMHEKLNMCNNQKDVFELLGVYAYGLVSHVASLRKSEHNKPVRDAQKYIQAHYATPISLDALSQRAGFNSTYFSSLFKKETGVNFLEYLTDIRIREAKRLLSDPRKTIADVAEEVGYSDVKHFSKLFTRIAGLHPSKYRKLYY